MEDIPLDKPLTGIKVVEFSNMITASLAAMMFAQQGADVIKVEPEGIGDLMRHLGSQKGGISGVFHNCNRAKRSIALDLKSEKGVAAARALCLDADIVIHNYRPGVMDRLGLGADSLLAEKPSLIYAAISGFGIKGPMADAPAYDHVVQSMAGIMATQGSGAEESGSFAYIRMAICDKITAYTAAQAVTAALFVRERTGKGQYLELSMLNSTLAFMWPDGMMHDTLLGEDVVHLLPYSDYYQRPVITSDGAVAFAAANDAHWQATFRILGYEKLKDDPRFADMATRGKNIVALINTVTERPYSGTSAELLSEFAHGDVPASPCLGLGELKDNEQIIAIEALEEQDHPLLGTVRHVTAPVHFDGKRPTSTRPSPALGEHTAEILQELDL